MNIALRLLLAFAQAVFPFPGPGPAPTAPASIAWVCSGGAGGASNYSATSTGSCAGVDFIALCGQIASSYSFSDGTNTYTYLGTTPVIGGQFAQACFTAKNASATGALTVSCTGGCGGGSFVFMGFGGLTTSSPVDTTLGFVVSSSYGYGNTNGPLSGTPTNASSLIISSAGGPGSYTQSNVSVGSPFTGLFVVPYTSGSYQGTVMSYAIQVGGPSSASVTYTWPSSSSNLFGDLWAAK